ncbi:hypothetical protein I315_06074 [Cryptococcus gattii Ru294]|uniref:Uncharacterized protein n=2 Tax=Cryptococcus gattii TaxID=37769 RepID=E6RBH4_CRYGW|nr:Hypothetical protein CGB_H5740W [Cryptococcus gattii WM276]KIR51377.1 hypothetical protein I315_06074 [Cryptococcus gattii Ru294]KIR81208.1 hypothetical protein I306_01752 [Cryptococcus gattii EJB2]KIY34798.1 hypothetical protein I305_02356 [Cryptococcus gattii E566]KJE01385.1 hypothetical protein I311_05036 [Cryptococcus gattii NT-10]ADV24137.1 Hypothetical protein CGB_H5740W [Cryptococcus gattii WM276]
MCPSYSGLSILPSRYLITIIRSLILLFAALTVLFLILPGVSGNKTGFYWVNIEYEGDEGTWEVGALGSCQYGTEYVFPFCFFLPGERLKGGEIVTKVDLDDYCPVDALLLAGQILHIGDLFIAFSFSTWPVRSSSPLSFPSVELVLG